MTTDQTPVPESARALLWRHGVPEDVIDGVLCLHAQELAAVIRSNPGAIPYRPQLDEDGGFWWDLRDRDAAADLIDPTRTAPAVSSVPPPADRAAVLTEAIAALDKGLERFFKDWPDEPKNSPWVLGWKDATTELRRLAAEEQPTEAHAAEHIWAAELYDPVADEWVPGTRYTVRDRAVNHLAHARTVGPTWKDGTPTQRRLVRATTTYTVETEHTPPAEAAAP